MWDTPSRAAFGKGQHHEAPPRSDWSPRGWSAHRGAAEHGKTLCGRLGGSDCQLYCITNLCRSSVPGRHPEVPARKYHNHKPSHRLRAGLEGCGPDRGCHPFEARRAKMRTERLSRLEGLILRSSARRFARRASRRMAAARSRLWRSFETRAILRGARPKWGTRASG